MGMKKIYGLIWFLIFCTLFEWGVARNLSFYGLVPGSSVGQLQAVQRLIDGQTDEELAEIRWLVLGDSQSRDGIRPRLVAKELGCSPQSILNLSINAGKPTDFAYFLEEVLPRLPHLEGVLISVNEHYFDRQSIRFDGKFRFLASFQERMMVPGPERQADLLLSKIFYTYGMEKQWWETIKYIWSELGTGGLSVPKQEGIGGLPPVTQEAAGGKSYDYARRLASSWMTDFRLGEPETFVLEEILDQLKERELAAALIHLPKTPLLEGMIRREYPQQEQDFIRYLNHLAKLYQFSFYRDWTLMGGDCFRDANHVNYKGARILAPQIGRILESM